MICSYIGVSAVNKYLSVVSLKERVEMSAWGWDTRKTQSGLEAGIWEIITRVVESRAKNEYLLRLLRARLYRFCGVVGLAFEVGSRVVIEN